MGHSNLDMTKRYLALTSQDIQGEHAKSSPLTKIAGRKARAVRLSTGKGESEED
jgi:hypothetical protein